VTDDPIATAAEASRDWLLADQYKTDANLTARQAIYAYQRPRMDIARTVIDRAGLRGDELVADVGCGNGAYLAELARRGHGGRVVGFDLSPGMLRASRDQVPGVALIAADAAALPLPSGATDVTMAIHMLYHLPDPAAAVRELRRVTRAGGTLVVGLNGERHMGELREAMNAVRAETGRPEIRPHERVSLDVGERLLAGSFGAIVRHDFTAELVIADPQPVADYVRSTWFALGIPDVEAFVAAVLGRLPRGTDGVIRITTHSGCLVCS
jgi:SAM-dependent methyltransferase